MLPNLFKEAAPVLELIENAGYEAYFVGGSVRDHLLGRSIADVDIATSALPEELKRIFSKTVDVGIEHGTILVHHGRNHYEVTTFRSETGYSDFRRPDSVTFIRSLKEDLQRRDFTMNAIAMDRTGQIIDPFGGRDAIDQRIIVTVGDPDARFGEDALRMLRAVRFLSQLSFSIEQHTFESLAANSQRLENIAAERKLSEFEKLLLGPRRQEAIQLLSKSGMSRYLPGLNEKNRQLISFSSHLTSDLDLAEIWVLLLFELGLSGKEVDNFLREWKHSVQKIKRYKQIHSMLLHRFEYQWNLESVYKAGLDVAISAEKVFGSLRQDECSLEVVIQLYDLLPIYNRRQLAVSGNDVMTWMTKQPGPWLSETMAEIERAVIFGKVPNEKEKLKEWLNAFNRESEKN
ncbi:CCA tRNA nucleotidyltransferase [Mesobacillus stamsii]|uniref:CCA-adding enzyme n=3 Tax=Mesobacillus TaxID=2675231 RepID=A0A0D6Z688_9BACI|nr:CCA tRNA nucleotidyltransferase [Mesobacillus stamsii]KIY20795.1 tRNA nucleotidyltransferase [Mesobacillus subterraneus]MDQ0412086.1 tRNA nucleotidyltransferase (CCA-adding enzyme) [Mesobacillus stamsii]